MKVLTWIIRLWILLLLTAFAIKNAEIITLKTFLGYEWQAPLILILVAFFAGGVLIGFLERQTKVFRLKREISQLKRMQEKDLAAKTEANNTSPVPQL